MSKRFRYLIIAVGIVIFLIIAPLIIFFISGTKFDLNQRRFVATGLLAFKTEPKNVEIFLDNEPISKSTTEIRFLVPKNYTLAFKKSGYYDWSKTLLVEPKKVTWANPKQDKIYLVYKDENPLSLASDITDFITSQNRLAALTDNQVLLSDSWDLATARSFTLPHPATQIQASPDFSLFLLTYPKGTGTAFLISILEPASNKFYDISGFFKTAESLPELAFSANNRLFALADNILFEIDVRNQTQTQVAKNVSGFFAQGQNLYYFEILGLKGRLVNWNLDTGEKLALSDNLPLFESAQIIANPQKQILLISDEKLYTLSTSGLKQLAENVKSVGYDSQNGILGYWAGGELRYFNGGSEPALVTRTAESLQQPKIAANIGYAIYKKNQTLEALELDLTSEQNNYQLYAGTLLKKYSTSPNAEQILILDGITLKQFRLY